MAMASDAEFVASSALTLETVTSVGHWNEHLFSFAITQPPTFRFRSGEFVMIGLPQNDGRPLLRAYSIASPAYHVNAGQIPGQMFGQDDTDPAGSACPHMGVRPAGGARGSCRGRQHARLLESAHISPVHVGGVHAVLETRLADLDDAAIAVQLAPTVRDSPSTASRSLGMSNPYLSIMPGHRWASARSSSTMSNRCGAVVSMPNASAAMGKASCSVNRSPLVRLNASFRVFGASAAHTSPPAQQVGVGDIGNHADAVGDRQRQPRLLAQGREQGEDEGDVHVGADRIPHDRARRQDRPGPGCTPVRAPRYPHADNKFSCAMRGMLSLNGTGAMRSGMCEQ